MNKRKRAELLKQAAQDEKLQAVLYKKCVADWKYFINTFCWTYDPRLNNPHLPFILYPKQEELISFLEKMLSKSRRGEQVAVIIDKPRDVGATFTCMVWGFWHFMFDEFSFRVGSRKEDYVDKKGDVDTLFFKIDYNLRRIPKFLMPKGYKERNHRGSLMLMNPENSNAITGESANPNFGRGGRKSAILFDELGFWDWSRASWESAGESTNLRIAMSTPPESGKDSHFFKLNIGERGRIYKFNFEWTDVPSRDQQWLSDKKENKSESEFAREVMKSYEGTTEGKVYATDMKYVKLTNVDYNPNLALYVTWDIGLDATSLIWIQKSEEGKIKIIDSYENSNKEIGFFIPFVTGEIISGYDYNEYDMQVIKRHREWTDMVYHFGDPSVKHRNEQTGESTRDMLMDKHGIYIESKDWGSRRWLDLRDQTKPLFRRMEINERRCEYLLSCLRSARYPRRTETSQNTSESQKPIHDWSSHFRSALEYFADNEPGYIPAVATPQRPVQQSAEPFEDEYEKYYVI